MRDPRKRHIGLVGAALAFLLVALGVASAAEPPYVFVGKFGGGPGTATGQFVQPNGVAVDAAGNVYVADTLNGRVQEFSSTGTFICWLKGWPGKSVPRAQPIWMRRPSGVLLKVWDA